MRIVRILMQIVGVLACLLGLLWMGQGSGYFPYPPANFMIGQTQWLIRGALLFALGVVIVLLARRAATARP